jgi:hypothetical protein
MLINDTSVSSRSAQSTTLRRKAAGLVAVIAAAAAGVGTFPTAGSAQTSSPKPSEVKVLVNIPGQIPAGLTRYRSELSCTGVLGIPAPGAQTLTEFVDRAGGSSTFIVYTQAGTSCRFRLILEGSGNRAAFGNALFVGGSARAITTLTTVNSVAVDPGTAFESIDIPIEANTDAVWGALPVATTTTTTTTIATTTTTRPTTTLPPATTTPSTQPPVTQPPATQPPATQPPATQPPTTKPPVRLKIVKTSRCKSKYRYVEVGTNRIVRCLTTTEARRIRK